MKKLLASLNQPVKLPTTLPSGLPWKRPTKPTTKRPVGGVGEAVVGQGWTPPLDLLRERRRELALEPLSGVLEQRPALLRRGLLVGGLVVGGALGLCGLLLAWHALVKARVAELEGYEAEVAQLSKTLQGQKAELDEVKGGNQQLVERLTNVRSSSALLADLQLRVPEGVQITSVQMKGRESIVVKGLARDPLAFGRVNALELVMRRSPLIGAMGVKLAKAERLPARQVAVKAPEGTAGDKETPKEELPKLELPSAVEFELTAELTRLPANRLLKVLEGLQAEGMVRRLQVLERESLLP